MVTKLKRLPDSSLKCGRSGFTLIELMVVVVIMALLATVIMGSATYVNRLVREKRANTTCSVLETALYRYRSDYNKWPGGSDLKTTGATTFSGVNNAKVFGPLRSGNSANTKGIQYLDESTLFTVVAGKPRRLSSLGDNAKPAVPLTYATRNRNLMKYFTVVINVDNDTVTVSAPGLKDKEDDDES